MVWDADTKDIFSQDLADMSEVGTWSPGRWNPIEMPVIWPLFLWLALTLSVWSSGTLPPIGSPSV